MKKILSILLTVFIMTNTYASEDYACFKDNNKIIQCNEKSLLSAFHEIKTYQNKETKNGLEIRKNGKILVIVGMTSLTLGGAAAGITMSQICCDVIVRIGDKFPKLFGSMIIGGAAASIVGTTMMLMSPKQTADGTMTGFLSSDDGAKRLVELSDDDLLDYAKMDKRVSLRVMNIQKAIHGSLNEK